MYFLTQTYIIVSKCSFYRKRIKYLRLIGGDGGRRVDPHKINFVFNWQSPKSAISNASDNSIGAILSQIDQDGKERVFQYTNRVLRPSETHNFCINYNI
ncbi:hypothetical protein HZS_7885 [Henneguya salminicola]|nr:hypothetical protein HZS_7885 [Henneguya salminicola]